MKNPRQRLSSFLGIPTAFLCLAGLANAQTARQVSIESLFTPSGWMGDAEYGNSHVAFSGADRTAPHSEPAAIKVTYNFGPMRWAGIYWQNTANNWGDRPGNNYSRQSFSKVTFWARGETGNEVVEFKSGDISDARKQHRDSYRATLGRVFLTKNWKQYTIDLSRADLSSVIGAFGWVASADYNAGGTMTFFLDDIALE